VRRAVLRRSAVPSRAARASRHLRRRRGARPDRLRTRPQADGVFPVGGTQDHRRPFRRSGMIFSLRKRIHQLAGELLRAHIAPGRVAAAVLLGCIVGCTPFFGLHIFICIALAWVLRLNQVIVYGAANLSVPPMIPLIGLAAVQLGEKILHGRWLPLTRASFAEKGAHQIAALFFVDWLVGGVVLGAAIGAVAGGIAWRILSRRSRTPI